MTARQMGHLNLGMGGRLRAAVKGIKRMRPGRTNEPVQPILLLPTGLAGGLGQEVACPTAYADSPQKHGSPASPVGYRRTRRSASE